MDNGSKDSAGSDATNPNNWDYGVQLAQPGRTALATQRRRYVASLPLGSLTGY